MNREPLNEVEQLSTFLVILSICEGSIKRIKDKKKALTFLTIKPSTVNYQLNPFVRAQHLMRVYFANRPVRANRISPGF